MEDNIKEFSLKDNQKLIVRNPVEEDAQSLIELMKVMDCETKFLAREPGEFNLTVEQEKTFINNSLNNENSHFIIGEIEGRIVANCSVGIISKQKRFLHRAALGIAVSKDYWGKGIGNIMMKECIKWCSEKGVEQLELDVVTENKRALLMYENLGFEVYGTKKHALKYGDGTYADEYAMILFLNEIESE